MKLKLITISFTASISVNLRPEQMILNIDCFTRDYFVAGLPSIVDFRPGWTDKCYFAEEIQYVKGKYSPRWISGVDESFDGTIKELIDRLPGRKPKLYVVVKRYKDTYSFEADLWEDEAPFHITTPSLAPTEAATLVGVGPGESRAGESRAGESSAGESRAGEAEAG
ncbi:hypothetical protein PCH_Pc16g11340 [Penicillium rubens Wisconsin 54-1255]|uniref:Uncharacterized protein n=1 Tax=Penicillium rubens (strain ATCC 28089 / DSM 1075 / NRRL 1951 / Wisconsin 54-1255) TaxID=500485 RepID=B6H9N5_PENRW|nr:hypothetical protein PCH_Pc16g11340 [Penicillium rubens Wisconsin 54-1255]